MGTNYEYTASAAQILLILLSHDWLTMTQTGLRHDNLGLVKMTYVSAFIGLKNMYSACHELNYGMPIWHQYFITNDRPIFNGALYNWSIFITDLYDPYSTGGLYHPHSNNYGMLLLHHRRYLPQWRWRTERTIQLDVWKTRKFA